MPAYTTEMRTMAADIGNISTGQPVAPTKPTPPAVPTAPKPAVSGAPAITIPEPAGGSGIGRKVIYIVLGVALLGALYWMASLFLGGNQTVQESPSPSPTASATLTPSRTLSAYFQQTGTSVTLNDPVTAKRDFLNALSTQQISSQLAVRLPVTGSAAQTFAGFLGAVIMSPLDPAIASSSGQDWAVLAYGQKEHYDTKGQLILGAPTDSRLVLIDELTDVSAANQAMTRWEANGLASQLQEIFGFDAKKATVPTFSSGTYRQTPIQYQNFPYADSSLDWTILTASNNKNYLVIAGSREAMFFTLDQLTQ